MSFVGKIGWAISVAHRLLRRHVRGLRLVGKYWLGKITWESVLNYYHSDAWQTDHELLKTICGNNVGLMFWLLLSISSFWGVFVWLSLTNWYTIVIALLLLYFLFFHICVGSASVIILTKNCLDANFRTIVTFVRILYNDSSKLEANVVVTLGILRGIWFRYLLMLELAGLRDYKDIFILLYLFGLIVFFYVICQVNIILGIFYIIIYLCSVYGIV
jgi:hypothetical protein